MSVTVGLGPEILSEAQLSTGIEWLVLVSIHPDGSPGVGVRIDAEPGKLLPPQTAHWAVGHLRTDTKSEGFIAVLDTEVAPERAAALRTEISQEAARFGLTPYGNELPRELRKDLAAQPSAKSA